MSQKTSNIFRTASLTIDSTFVPNNSQLTFRPLQTPLNTVDDSYYSLGSAQTTDPTIRLNKYDASGTLTQIGYPYDTVFNLPPPGKILIVAGGEPPNNLVYTQDRDYWVASQNTGFTTEAFYAIAYNGSTWLAGARDACGENGIVVSSSNGINWLPNPGASGILIKQCNAIATNGTLWVAGGLGYNSTISGVSNSMCFSYDLVFWYKLGSADSIFTGGTITAIAQNNSIWLAGANKRNKLTIPYSMGYSLDGITWIPLVEGSLLLTNCNAFCWNGSLWNAGGDVLGITGTIINSLNGRYWTASTSCPIYSSVKTIAWNGIMWTVGGIDVSGQGRTLGYSYDGLNWYPSPSTSIFPSACNSITWDGIKWQAVGDSSIATSFNGIIWTINQEGSSILPQGNVIAVNKILPFVTPGNTYMNPTEPLSLVGGIDILGNCAIAYSTNGVSWTSSSQVSTVFSGSLPVTLVWNGSIWIGGFFTDGYGSPTVGYSYDGIIWNEALTGNGGMDSVFYSSAWIPFTNNLSGYFIGIGADLSFNAVLNLSYNGTNWSTLTPILDPSSILIGQNNQNYTYPQIVYNGTLWILTGAGTNSNIHNASIAYSSDGVHWTKSTSGSSLFTEHCSAILWNGSIWTAGGRDSSGALVAYSSDGINWTRGTLNGFLITGTACDIYSIAWNGLLFVIGGTGDNNRSDTGINIGYSYDGVQWFPAQYTFTEANTINTITWNGSVWIATGISNPLLDGYLGTLYYSYSGIEWYISPDVNVVKNLGSVVASNRLNPANGHTLPFPVYNQDISASNGFVMYSTIVNNLYKSTILSVDEANGVLGINETNRVFRDLNRTRVTTAVEISGGAITIHTSNTVPELYLSNNQSSHSGGRIELNDVSAQYGWRIDNNADVSNNLQITSFVGNTPYLAVDIRNKNNMIHFGIGTNADMTNALNVSSNIYIHGNLHVNGSKSFRIDHPNPMMTDTHYLRHSCLEGPTRGDTLYRWSLTTQNGTCVQTLPSYSPYLNEGWHFFVSAEDSFGTGYATLSEDETYFTLTVNMDGRYSVIGVATRKDKAAFTFDEKGAEYRE
jgi:hypothetical protein